MKEAVYEDLKIYSTLHNEEEEREEKEEAPSPAMMSNRLLKSRKILISSEVHSKLAERVISQLLFLEDDDPKKDITLYINSPGGEVYSGFAIFDTARIIKPRVRTVVVGLAASMGSILSLCADKGNRYCTVNSKILIHQPLLSGVVYGSTRDIEIRTKDMLRLKEQIIEIYMEATGKEREKIQHDLDRDYWLTPKEAIGYGLIDKIISSTNDLEAN